MAHKIIRPYDIVYSTVSREWHGLAQHVQSINRQVIEPILFPIVEGDITITLGGEAVKLDNQKALVADYRNRTDIPEGQRIQPLSVVGSGYHVIDNSRSLQVVEEALAKHGLDAKIVTAGTLRGGKNFFLSLQQDDCAKELFPNDRWEFYLSIATSHDATEGWQFYTSTFRTVCYNTFKASLEAADVKATIYHTKNANLQLDAMPEIVKAFRDQKTELIEALTHLAGIECGAVWAEKIVKGYFADLTGEKEFSRRQTNTVEGILGLFQSGRGNRGRSMYDLVNGFTDYYTNGPGTGRSSTVEDRAFRAEFGGAADHKTRFVQLMRDQDSRHRLADLGETVELAVN